MIPLLPKWNLHSNRPTFYDMDSVTMLELASTLHGSMNAMIEEYNALADSVNARITEFMDSETQDRELFETQIRQEFQDFIDAVELKYSGLEARLDAKVAAVEAACDALIAEINGAMENALNDSY